MSGQSPGRTEGGGDGVGDGGITGSIAGSVSSTEEIVVATMWIIAVWNSVQTLVFIFRTFKRKRGLYFARLVT
jgi:hypothetical protein